jgi:hypothetical protein
MNRQPYKAEKRRKEIARQKKQEEKRQKRQEKKKLKDFPEADGTVSEVQDENPQDVPVTEEKEPTAEGGAPENPLN